MHDMLETVTDRFNNQSVTEVPKLILALCLMYKSTDFLFVIFCSFSQMVEQQGQKSLEPS